MKKRTKWIAGVFVVVVLILSIFFFIKGFSPKLSSYGAQYGLGLLVFQEALGASGDSYYDERCVDVSQYYSQGYTNLRVDTHGCQIVGKSNLASEVDLGQKIYGNCEYFNYRDAKSPSCSSLGGGWVGSCRKCGNNNIWGCVICSMYSVDERGGFERVLNYCTYDQNDLLVAESFAGGQSITKFSLRYPMKSFCRAHPSIITDDATKTSITSTNIPQDLIDGNSVAIASAQTLTVFYVIENNANLPTICDSGNNLALDVGSNISICKSTLGFTYLCSEGQFDALSGTCVVQPESKTLCDKGRYDVGLDLCVYNPPLQVDCGANDCFYSVDRDVCSCYVQDEYVCPQGYVFAEPDERECTNISGDWLLCPQCPIDRICSSDICTARCSIGQRCEWDSPLEKICDNVNATIRSDGTCEVLGETIIVCAEGDTYEGGVCVHKPTIKQVCDDGAVPTTNPLTGELECIRNVASFHSCAGDYIYDEGLDRCVPQVQVYNPSSDEFIIYKEVQKDCVDDSICKSITASLVCNQATGVCQTPVYAKQGYTGMMVFLGILIVLCIVLLFMIISKRRRKK